MGGIIFNSQNQSQDESQQISTEYNLNTLEIVIFMRNLKEEQHNINLIRYNALR